MTCASLSRSLLVILIVLKEKPQNQLSSENALTLALHVAFQNMVLL